ncbi:MAG: DUF4249 domain-containing protein [Bacteroidales bacterium]|nr:DUF4249 domain-containing protein [Bacteroidales bacterium]
MNCNNRAFSTIMLLFIFGLIGGCSMDMDIELPEVEPRMAMYSIISPGNPIEARLTFTQPITQNMGYENKNWINDAVVRISEPGGASVVLENENSGSYLNSLIPQENRTYKFQAEHANYENISAETTIPYAVPVISIDTLTETISDGVEVEKRLLTRVKFQDPSETKNYYMVSKYTSWDENSGENLDYIWSYMEGYGILNVGGAIVFSDEMFNGQVFTVKFAGNEYYYDAVGVEQLMGEGCIYFCSIDENFYKYMLSMHKKNSGDEFEFFTEPVQIFSNVENGLGLFGSYSLKKYSIDY